MNVHNGASLTLCDSLYMKKILNSKYYLSGDEGIIDKRGYLQILSRINDVVADTGRFRSFSDTALRRDLTTEQRLYRMAVLR